MSKMMVGELVSINGKVLMITDVCTDNGELVYECNDGNLYFASEVDADGK